jgi:hypothetical protein
VYQKIKLKTTFFIFISFCGIYFEIIQSQEWINMKFKSAKCKVFDPSYGAVTKCYVKALSRNISTLNIVANITKVTKAPIFIECKAHYRFNTITRQIYPTTTFDFCAVMRGDGLVEKLTILVISFFKIESHNSFINVHFLDYYNFIIEYKTASFYIVF